MEAEHEKLPEIFFFPLILPSLSGVHLHLARFPSLSFFLPCYLPKSPPSKGLWAKEM